MKYKHPIKTTPRRIQARQALQDLNFRNRRRQPLPAYQMSTSRRVTVSPQRTESEVWGLVAIVAFAAAFVIVMWATGEAI